MLKINEGTYSKIYRTDQGIVAITSNKDQSKRILSTLSGRHIPAIQSIESNELHSKFTMPEYKPVTGDNLEMVSYMVAAWSNYANSHPIANDNLDGFYTRCKAFLCYIGDIIDRSLLTALGTILEAMPKTRLNWDFHLDNFMQENDDIILLDVIWDISDKI